MLTLYCILAVFGICLIAAQGSIFETFRNYLKEKFSIGYRLITCPMCLGFWVGLITGFFYGPFEYWNILFNGSFYSATTWLLYNIVVFLGNGYDPSRVINILTPDYIKISRKNENNNYSSV